LSGKTLVGFQVALSTLLVIGAGLFLRTLTSLSQVPLGFRPDHLLLAEIDPPSGRYPAGKDVALHQRLEHAIAAQPGVTSVTLAEDALVADDRSSTDFLPAGESYNPGKNQEELYNLVGNRFFETMGIAMVEGREFGPQDTADSAKVAVINESLARSRFPGVDAVGKRFVTDAHDSDGGAGPLAKNSIEIIGVCKDTRYANLREEPPPVFFLPYVQQPHVGGLIYEIRTGVQPESVLPAIRAVVHKEDPDLALTNVRTQQQQIDAALEQERIFVTLTSGFGLLALTLAAVGVYGVMAYSVAQRTNEIGIRLALGAQPRQMREMILGESVRLAGAGIVVGVVAALLLSRLVASMLYGVASNDPVTIVAGGLLLLLVALASSWIPARRAARTEPMAAIRCE
jgi:predicted permease